MKYLEKSFSFGYAGSKNYGQNYDRAFRSKPSMAWKHDKDVSFSKCCPCSGCTEENECTGEPLKDPASKAIGGICHCPGFSPKKGYHRTKRGA